MRRGKLRQTRLAPIAEQKWLTLTVLEMPENAQMVAMKP